MAEFVSDLRVGQRPVGPDGRDDLGRHVQEGLEDRAVCGRTVFALAFNAGDQQDQLALRGGQTPFLEDAFQAEIAAQLKRSIFPWNFRRARGF